MICVDCGEESAHLIRGSCPSCFIRRHQLLVVPEVVAVEVCAHCDARRIGSHWVEPDLGAPLQFVREDAVLEAVRVHERVQDPEIHVEEEELDERTFRCRVALAGVVEGVDLSTDRETTVRMRRSVCDRCSRIHGGHWASVVQLRATDRDVSQRELELAHSLVSNELDRQLQAGNRNAFLAKSEPMHGGFDYYIGDIDAGGNVSRVLRNTLGATHEESAKLVGRREGENVYRVTFLVRIRLLAPGDFIRAGDQVLQVEGLGRGSIAAVDLRTHQRTKVPDKGIKRLGGPEQAEEAVVVFHDADNVQILDPASMQAVDLPRPPGYEPDGSAAKVVRHDETLHLVPHGRDGSNKP